MRLDRAVALVWRVSPAHTAATAVLAVVQGLLPLASLLLMKVIVDRVTFLLGGAGESTSGPAAAMSALSGLGLGWLIALAAAAAFLGVVAQLLMSLVNQAQSLRVTDYVTDVLHAKSVEVDLEYYEDPRYFDLLHRAQAEAPYRPTRVVDGLLALVRNGVSLVGVLALLVSFRWWVALGVTVAALPGILVKARYSGRLFAEEMEWTPDERRAGYLNWLLTARPAAKELRLLRLGDLFRTRYTVLRTGVRARRLRLTRRRSLAEAGAELVALAAVFAALGFVAFRTVAGALTLGSMVMYFGAVQNASSSLRAFLSGVAGLYEDNTFLAHFQEFMGLEPRVLEPAHPRAFPPRLQSIFFEQVAFRYPGSDRQALRGVSLELRPGEITALVGRNGSGKTTLVKLLCRLYDPTQGRVLIDGVDLRDFGLVELRRNLSVIFQDYVQYNFTARDNIWLGDVDSDASGPRLQRAAETAGAHDLLQGLAGGYNTVLGKWFEDGEELSVGEWQRVALARAFLPDAQVLVLDEPTSSLDAEAEAAVFAHLRELAEGRAVLIISHRFSTVRMADRIVLLDRGEVAEQGGHDELMALDGAYARMFRVQAAR